MAVKDGKEYVSFMAKRFVAYMETPTEERRRMRTEAKSRREPWLAKWFGWAQYGIVLRLQARKARKERTRAASVIKERDMRQS